ncbi:MAG: hypothetical protein WCX97_04540 [Candidatus Magasanikbacteria bacterium]
MRKILVIFLTVVASSILITSVWAAPAINELTSQVGSKAGYETNVDTYTISRMIGLVIRGAMGLVGMIFLVLTIYAGFLWMTAGGNEESVNKAQGILKRAVIGLVIVFFSYSITVFVAMILGGSGDQGFWSAFSNYGYSLFNGQSVNLR